MIIFNILQQINNSNTKEEAIMKYIVKGTIKSASDRKNLNNVNFYDVSYTHYGYCSGTGGRSITYPLCNSNYPCQAFANVNGSFQGKAVVPD